MDTQPHSLLSAAIEAHQHKGQGVDREDRSTAAHVVEQLLPNPESRSTVLQVLAELIEHAHTRGDRKWAITLFDRLARLNVGCAWSTRVTRFPTRWSPVPTMALQGWTAPRTISRPPR